MTIEQVKELARYAAMGSAPANFSVENVDAALADGLKEIASDYYQFMEKRYMIFSIISQAVDAVVPNRVINDLGILADVRTIGQGEKAVFKQKVGASRARKFLTRVGLSGVYETVRLDQQSFEVPVYAVGGACTLDYERMLDGAEVLADYVRVMADGLVDSVFIEVQKALRTAINATGRPAANKVTGSYSADQMFALVNTVRAYGNGATIFASPEFVAKMGPDAIVPVTVGNSTNYGGVAGVYHPQDIDAIHNQGYINLFRGTPIVTFRQSYWDDKNTQTVIDPQLAYVLPNGGERVVKVVLEGATQMREDENRDGSMEINFYKKIGAAILSHKNWGIYQNTSIPQTLAPELQ